MLAWEAFCGHAPLRVLKTYWFDQSDAIHEFLNPKHPKQAKGLMAPFIQLCLGRLFLVTLSPGDAKISDLTSLMM